jgi:hypothetical protein
MFSLTTSDAASTYDHKLLYQQRTDASCYLPEQGAVKAVCSKEYSPSIGYQILSRTANWRLKLKQK